MEISLKPAKKSREKGRSAPNKAFVSRVESPSNSKAFSKGHRPPKPISLRITLASCALVLCAGIWSYGPTLRGFVVTWAGVADYSHGFFVVPLALYFLWVNRKSCPSQISGSLGAGGVLFVASVAARVIAHRYYLPFVDGWSILIWLASIVTTLGGVKLLRWAAPSIGFLAFMIPLPFGVEVALSQPLQRIATRISCYTLQLLGQPAFAEGNVILIGDLSLEVAQACSGLRLFFSIVALAYAYVVVIRRAWWEKLIVALATVPIAILCNAARIVATGLLLQATSGEWAHSLAHDIAGWGMIPAAAVSFWIVQWYVGLLFRADEPLDFTTLVQRASL